MGDFERQVAVVGEFGADDDEGLQADGAAAPAFDGGAKGGADFGVGEQESNGVLDLAGEAAGFEGVKVAPGGAGAESKNSFWHGGSLAGRRGDL